MLASVQQSIQAVAAIIAAILGGTALIYSMFAQTRALKVSHYNELDKTYQTLLNLALQNPYFVSPESIETHEQKQKYNIYAFMVWNFLEAIYDKCLNDKHLNETWVPIIEVEGKIHLKWFKHVDNAPKFKDSFREYIFALLSENENKPA